MKIYELRKGGRLIGEFSCAADAEEARLSAYNYDLGVEADAKGLCDLMAHEPDAVRKMLDRPPVPEPDKKIYAVEEIDVEDVPFEDVKAMIADAGAEIGLPAVARLMATPVDTIKGWLYRGSRGRLKSMQIVRLRRLCALLAFSYDDGITYDD